MVTGVLSPDEVDNPRTLRDYQWISSTSDYPRTYAQDQGIEGKGQLNSQARDSDLVSQILPYLFLGPCSATSASSTFVARQGVTHIISVGKKPELTLDSITYLRLSIEDDPAADMSKAGGEATAFINKARARQKSSKIFVHCSAGISRSPAVVTFYLMKSCDMSLKRALGLVVSARPHACPNPGFILQLQQAELEYRGSSSLPPV